MKDVTGSIKLEDEFGEIIDSCKVSIQVLMYLLNEYIPKDELEQTFCLQFIDPYGYTTFNELQIPVLIKELKYLHSKCLLNDKSNKLKSVINFTEKAIGKDFIRIRFYGD